MNKNIKKTLISCLYGITLSANITLCCEKNLNLILNSDQDPSLNINEVLGYINQNFNNQPNTEQIDANPETKKRKITEITNLLNPDDSFFNKESDKIQKIENEYTKIDFSLIDTDDKYANIYSKILGGKKALVTIKCDVCNLEINSPLGEARNGILAHRLTQHIEQYPSKPNKNRKKEISRTEYIAATNQQLNKPTNTTRPEQQINSNISQPGNNIQSTISAFKVAKKIEPKKIQPIEDKYTEIDFSYIITPEKYKAAYSKLEKGKEALVTITCDECALRISGDFNTARNSMLTHRTAGHIIEGYTKLNVGFNSGIDSIKYIDLTSANQENNNISSPLSQNKTIDLDFSSIDTDEKYENVTSKFDNGKATIVTVCCDECPTKRKGKLSNIRSALKNHKRAKHGWKGE